MLLLTETLLSSLLKVLNLKIFDFHFWTYLGIHWGPYVLRM